MRSVFSLLFSVVLLSALLPCSPVFAAVEWQGVDAYPTMEERSAWEERAKGGDSEAQYRLGEFLHIFSTASTGDNGEKLILAAARQQVLYAQCSLITFFENEQHQYQSEPWYNKDKIVKQILEEAEKQPENMDAQFWAAMILGDMDRNEEALSKMQKCADNGYLPAIRFSANMFEKGLFGVNTDIKKSAEYYKKAAQLGDCISQHKYGVYLMEHGSGDDYKLAVLLFRKASEQGFAAAQSVLGQALIEGTGCERDEKAGFAFTKKAAEAGVIEALMREYYCYLNGTGVEKDDKAALQCLEQAVERKYPEAYNELGACYGVGALVKQDYKKALEYYRLADKAAYPAASFNLFNMYSMGTGVELNDERAYLYLRRSAELGYAPAQNELGYAYATARFGLVHDDEIAVFWYKRGVAQDFPPALLNYALCLKRGDGGLEPDEKKFFSFCGRSAENGFPPAMYMLACAYEEGVGTGINLKMARSWYRKAARLGFEDAKKALKRLGVTEK